MYTQCPDCRASFRVTAAVLQQAAGRVRCGGCGCAFNALERLSETPPVGGDRCARPDDFEALSATDNVRIEDTGVEWQVVEDEDPAGSDPQEPLDLGHAAEQRYDDNTPLPDVFEDEDERTPGPPRRRAEDVIEPRSPEFDERQADLALSEPEDWTDLLDEVGDAVEPAAAERVEDDGGTRVDEDTQPGLEVLDADAEPTGEHPAPGPAPAAGTATPTVEPADGSSREPGDAPASAPADSGHYVPPPTDDEITINRLIDQDLLRLSQEQQDLVASGSHRQEAAEPPPHVETIIMEGAFVRSSLEADEPAEGEQESAEHGDAAGDVLDLRDTYVRTRDRHREGSRRATGGGRYAAAAGTVALALLLAGQVVHGYRETLATYGTFGDSLVSLYAAAGTPITPQWDANGWQFLETRGSTDAADSALTISSRLANASGEPLPYPLLHVALTDRYEEVIASQLLEARQYLAIRAAKGRVAPGGKLSANITIAPLAPQAAGFKLNVCYPLNASEVRCATGAFKDR